MTTPPTRPINGSSPKGSGSRPSRYPACGWGSIPLPGPEPAERLHKVPGRVDKGDLAVILRAITLYLARNADLDDDSLEKSGKAIAAICRAYLTSERSQRHAHQDPSGA